MRNDTPQLQISIFGGKWIEWKVVGDLTHSLFPEAWVKSISMVPEE